MSAVFTLESGSEVTAQGRRYRIHRVCDLDSVLAVDVETNATTRIRLRDMQPAIKHPEADVVSGVDLQNIPERDWEIARGRFHAIEPLLRAGTSVPGAIAMRAVEVGKDRSTLYRWLSTYIHGGTLASLLPAKSGGAAGQKRLENDVELVIAAAIEDRYLKKQRISAEQVAREIVIRCARLGLTPPHPATVRRRIAAVDECVTVHRREGGKQMRQRFGPVEGAFPGADAPLRFVQIDHTPVDLELVDDIHRRPIGRPWITVAIDVYSRMIAGFYVSFDPPGALSTGLCLAHAILPKDVWLARFDIAATWPVWGIMDAVHCDNAKEFHGAMLEKACQNYGIALRFRPVRQPHYGGHIERFLGTFAARIHALPGTTFSNPSERGAYDSERHAALTLSEFEKWLATYIVEVYHREVHSALGMPPLKKYEQGILGDGTHPGRGLPARCGDETKLRLDFLPFFERTVQRSGISLDEIHYFADVLRRWINAKDSADPTRKRQFIVRRDPRDISVVYFHDPEAQQYFRIPYRDTAHPPLSIWELQQIRRQLQEQGRNSVDEQLIFAAYERLRTIEQNAVRTTKAARRKQQRERLHQCREELLPASVDQKLRLAARDLETPEGIRPFQEIEVLK